MAEPAKDQDQSMEDILQSIKRIIAEEGEGAPDNSSGSDVLELTELLADDGSVSRVQPGATDTVPSMSIDEIMAAPIASAPTPEPTPGPEPVFTPEPEPELAAAEPEENLISNATLSASVAALNALRDSMTPAAPRYEAGTRGGITVEELALEGLRPLLKEWLDANLPGLVERLVQKEISKLTR